MTTAPTPTQSTDTLTALTPAEAQRVYRRCLDALARPGTVVPLGRADLPARFPASMLPILALTDLMSPVAGIGSTTRLREITTLTGAPLVDVPDARWVHSPSDAEADRWREIPTGTALSPEHGAIVCHQTAAVSSAPIDGSIALSLTGPGVRDTATVHVDGLTADHLAVRRELCGSFPRGIDLLLVTDTHVVGIARTTTIQETE